MKAPLRIKICGLTRLEDARHALACGAHALGFVFHPGSPRCIQLGAYQVLRRSLPPWAYTVAVFTTEDRDRIEETVTAGGFPAFQVHGADEIPPPELPGRVFFRAFDPTRDDPGRARDHLAGPPGERGLLLDARSEDLAGGTGTPLPQEALEAWRDLPDLVLAGGLEAGNVADLVTHFDPAGVDASSRLEVSPGKKAPEKVAAFVAAARAAAAAPVVSTERTAP